MKIGDNDSNVDLFNFETPLKIPLTLEKLSIEELTGYFIEYLTDSVIKDKINSPLYIITQTTESKRLETIQTALELSSISKFDFINTKIALSEYVSSLVESPEKNIIVVDFGFSKFGLYHFEKEIKNDQKEYNLKSSKIYKFGAANIINKISEDISEFYNQHCVGANGNKIKKMEAFNYSIKAFEGLTHSKYLPFPIKYEDCLISLKREKYFEDNLVEVFLKDFLRTSNLDSNMDGLKFVTIGSASYSPVLKDLIEKMVKLDQIFVPNEPKYSLVSGSVTLLKNAVSQNLKICDESLYFILDNQTKLDLGDEDGCILLSKNFSQKYTNLKDNFTFTFFSHDQPLYELICTITDEAISENGSFEIFFKLESSLHISIKEVKYSAEDSEKQELGKNVGIKCVKKIKSPLSLEVLNGITSRITSYREKEQEIKNRDFEMKKLVEKVEFYKALLAKLTEDENILSKKNETVYQIQVSKLDHFKDVLNSFELKMLTIKGSEKSEEISGYLKLIQNDMQELDDNLSYFKEAPKVIETFETTIEDSKKLLTKAEKYSIESSVSEKLKDLKMKKEEAEASLINIKSNFSSNYFLMDSINNIKDISEPLTTLYTSYNSLKSAYNDLEYARILAEVEEKYGSQKKTNDSHNSNSVEKQTIETDL